MKLHFAPRTRATRPRWLIEELGVAYDLVRLDLGKREHKAADYLAVHPLGHVPALEDGDLKMFESSAICMYLADKFLEKKLAPPHGSAARGRYYQWMVFAMATLEPPVLDFAQHTRMLPEDERVPAIVERSRKRFREVASAVDAALGDRDFLLGDFSAADVMIGSVLGWAKALGLLVDHPKLLAYVARLVDRPAYKAAST